MPAAWKTSEQTDASEQTLFYKHWADGNDTSGDSTPGVAEADYVNTSSSIPLVHSFEKSPFKVSH